MDAHASLCNGIEPHHCCHHLVARDFNKVISGKPASSYVVCASHIEADHLVARDLLESRSVNQRRPMSYVSHILKLITSSPETY